MKDDAGFLLIAGIALMVLIAGLALLYANNDEPPATKAAWTLSLSQYFCEPGRVELTVKDTSRAFMTMSLRAFIDGIPAKLEDAGPINTSDHLTIQSPNLTCRETLILTTSTGEEITRITTRPSYL